MTPSLERCGIAGVMRAVVLREAAAAGTPVKVKDMPVDILAHCSGLLLTNALIGVLAVNELDGRELTASNTAQALARQVSALDG
jgi:4-amino-4-deoxychorismate lyase